MKLCIFRLIWVVSLFFVTLANAAFVEPANTTLFILLDASGFCNSTESASWKGFGINDYISDKIVGRDGFVYCHSYDSKSKTPMMEAKEFVNDGDGKSIYDKALDNWFLNSDNEKLVVWKKSHKNKSLSDLKTQRPDIVPLKYVVIAEGVGGLVVREYIQSDKYQGEMENVLFFNTPHEGTGFADQALFHNSNALKKTKDASSYAAIIPLALTAYLVGGVGGLQELMLTLVKSAVVGMAADIGGDASKAFADAGYFNNLSASTPSLWYLAQDADMTDSKYTELENISSNVEDLVGSTQLLNSFSKKNNFAHPNYNVIYSNGFPSIGNGRRTLDDYANRRKMHVTAGRLKKAVGESLKSVLDENGIPYTQEQLASLVDGMLNGETSAAISDKAKELVGQLSEHSTEIANYAQGIMELKSLKLNKDDIPGSIVKLLSIVYKFLPEEYKSEIYSTIIDNFSPETASMIKKYGECAISGNSVKSCAMEGFALVATSLSNYSLNFFDDGTFDVPVYSAYGENVKAFKEGQTSRFGYELADIVEKNKSLYPNLTDYQNLLSDLGKLEKTRKITDIALNIGCEALDKVNPAYGKICKAAEFAVNVGLIGETSIKIKKIAQKSGALKDTKYIALKQSIVHMNEGTIYDRLGKSKKVQYTDLDKMLFGEPFVSLVSVQQNFNGVDSIIPMLLSKICDSEIYDYASVCKDDVGQTVNLASFVLSSLSELDLNSDFDRKKMSIKKNAYSNEGGVIRKNFKYYQLPAFTANDYINEFRFQIDDLQPDSLYLIKLDFNARIQFAFERTLGSGAWDVYVGIDNQWELVESGRSSPVDERGLFVFDPKVYLDKTKNKLLLSAMEEDGPNVVNIVVENKLGYVSNQQFSYIFKATSPLLEEGWPRNYDKVSQFDEASIYMNDLGYGDQISSVGLRIAKIGVETETVDSVENVPYELLNASIGKRWKITADLKSMWERNPIVEDGSYLLEWEIVAKDTTGSFSRQQLKTIVFVDVKAPDLDMDIYNNVMNEKTLAGRWGFVKNLDPVGKRSIRAIRGYLVPENANTHIEVFRKTYFSGAGLDIEWDSFSPISVEGRATFYVQAFDFANPNENVAVSLRTLDAKTENWWNVVLDNQGLFKKGINGTILDTIIYIDRTAPKISNESLNLKITSAPHSIELPQFDKLTVTDADYVLNLNDTLKIKFDIDEPLYNRDSSLIFVDILFKNAALDREREYEFSMYLKKGRNSFEFVEPEANRLPDGVYEVVVKLVDEAGNVSENTVISNLRVDRTPPVINDVFCGGDAFENVDEITNADVFLSQSSDVEQNRSDLTCFVKLNTSGVKTDWYDVGTEKESKNLSNDAFVFDLKSRIPADAPIGGKWFVYVGCFDAAGNYGAGVDFFGMGERYPQIGFPTNKNNDFFSGKILVSGIAPNPIVHGNDNEAEFEIRWRAENDTVWNTSGIIYLLKDVSLSERNLAVWDASNLNNATYILQLRVRGCSDEIKCGWVSTEEKITILDVMTDPTVMEPKFVFTPPVDQIPGDAIPFEFELANADSKSKWSVNLRIDVQSPRDPSARVVGMERTFNPMIVSPFAGEKVEKSDGLTIWQDADATWNLYWKGTANGVEDDTVKIEPMLVFKYLKDAVSSFGGSAADSLIVLESAIPAVKTENLLIPAYDNIKKWLLGVGKVIHVRFKTDSSFSIDLSSVEGAATRIYFGKSDSLDYVASVRDENGNLKYYDTRVSPVVYVHPNQYKSHFKWNGLTETGLYPSGSSVVLNAFIYNKDNNQQVYFDSRTWNLKLGASRIITEKGESVGEMYIGFADSSNSAPALAKQNIGVEYGIAGRPAFITAQVLDSQNNVIKTLMEHEYRIAGSDSKAYYVSWNGISENNFAITDVGRYKIRLLAADSMGKVQDTFDYEFDLKYAGSLVEAPRERTSTDEFPAELTIDEVEKDTNGDFRFVGKPDYLLRAHLSAKKMPEEDTVFRYRWDIENGAVQYPTIYEKNRYSLGIRRHRNRFKVTVAALVASYGINWSCTMGYGSVDDNVYPYRIIVDTLEFVEEGDNKPMDLELDPGLTLVAYDTYPDPNEDYPIMLGVKIFPKSAFESIRSRLESKTNLKGTLNSDVEGDFSWLKMWNKGDYKQTSHMYDWFSDFSQTLLWETTQNQLKYNSKFAELNYEVSSDERCVTDDIKSKVLSEDNNTFVCGMTNAREETNANLQSFNPHKNMLKITAIPYPNESEFATGKVDRGTGCRDHNGSRENVKIRLKFEVLPKYWNPAWGTNNLANRYVRFDSKNKTVFSDEGYMKRLKTDANNPVPTFFDGNKYVFPADSGYYGNVTAFESQRFVMIDAAENPLLFADEVGGKTINSTSTYSWRYYLGSDNVKYQAVAKSVTSGKTYDTFKTDDDDARKYKDRTVTSLSNPYDIYFEVAPVISIEELNAHGTNNAFSVSYPYKNDGKLYKDENYKFYGFGKWASRIHYGVKDWKNDDWADFFANGNGILRNPVTDPTVVSMGIFADFSYTSATKNELDNVYVYKVKEKDSEGNNVWTIPFESLEKLEFDEIKDEKGNLIDYDKKLVNLNPDSKWIINQTKKSISHEGIGVTSTPEYVLSWDDDFVNNRPKKDHNIELPRIKDQNPKDSILGKRWIKNIQVSSCSLYVRDTVNDDGLFVEHPYFGVSFEVDGNDSLFRVKRTPEVPLESRVKETATIRGRVPGDNEKWKLLYTKNGMLFTLDTGTQENVPHTEPYPILSTFDMNRLQGNTSFFLTYGSTDGATFFRQMNVRVGELVDNTKDVNIQSMYGNVSIKFSAHSWEEPVDVTVRTISKNDYNFNAFKGLSTLGPVIEVLPSHKFPDSQALWPEVHVVISRASLKSMDPSRVKIYKPDFENGEILPLETQISAYLDENGEEVEFDGEWVNLKISAKTPSFSTFFAMDEQNEKNVELVNPPEKTELECNEMMMDTLWMGIANGWLEYPYPCFGKSNYSLQLRKDSSVAAEYQGASASPIVWNARKPDIYIRSESYHSRVVFYGENKSIAMRGPVVQVDSTIPEIEEIELETMDDGNNRKIHITASLKDVGSGIQKTKINTYYAGNLIESRTIELDTSISEYFMVNRKQLYECIGCKLTAEVYVEDKGHNYVRETLVSKKLYPYPESLVLWYPLVEGTGEFGYELMGTGLDLDLFSLKHRWSMGNSLYLWKEAESATSNDRLFENEETTPFTIEFAFRSGYRPAANSSDTYYSIVGFNGGTPWTIGVRKDGRYFIDYRGEKIVFSLSKGMNAFERITLVAENNAIHLYKNGKYEETKHLKNNVEYKGSGRIVVGNQRGFKAVSGYLKDVRLYSSALTAEEIADIHKGSLDLDSFDMNAERAVSLNYENLKIDQSCSAPGMSFLRQKNALNSPGHMTWTVDMNAGRYSLYLLTRNYVTEESKVEIFQNGASLGVRSLKSTGLWNSQVVNSLTLNLGDGETSISVRPLGNLGVAGVAIANADKMISAEQINYGESEWKNPEPRVKVMMNYEASDDITWGRVRFQLKNISGENFAHAKLRYYYRGEGSNVQAVAFYPYSLMNVVHDAGSTYYVEFPLTETIESYGTAFYGNGPLIGFHRSDYYFPWNIYDDPSYVTSAEDGFVDATGVALLDEDGNLLNRWSCHDDDGLIEEPQKQVRVLAKDSKAGSAQSSNISMVVENVGSVPVEGFEVRYYYRDDSPVQLNVYSNQFARSYSSNVGGDLNYIAFIYENTILNPGEKSDFGNGVQFEIFHDNWTNDFYAMDDPSHHNLGSDFVEADSVLILDKNGNLLWGGVPQPRFNSEYEIKNQLNDLVRRDGDVIYVQIDDAGTYVLEIVNAIGIPQSTLFDGRWSAGEHTVAVPKNISNSGNYIVLRSGNRILSWQIFN